MFCYNILYLTASLFFAKICYFARKKKKLFLYRAWHLPSPADIQRLRQNWRQWGSNKWHFSSPGTTMSWSSKPDPMQLHPKSAKRSRFVPHRFGGSCSGRFTWVILSLFLCFKVVFTLLERLWPSCCSGGFTPSLTSTNNLLSSPTNIGSSPVLCQIHISLW